jgi:hypothetical protein
LAAPFYLGCKDRQINGYALDEVMLKAPVEKKYTLALVSLPVPRNLFSCRLIHPYKAQSETVALWGNNIPSLFIIMEINYLSTNIN